MQHWLDAISNRDLPILRASLQALGEQAQLVGEINGSQISTVVLPDPMLVLKVMRMANSGRSNRFAQPVVTIEHAVMMVGLGASFNQMLACEALEDALSQEAQSGLLRCVGRARHAATQARDWATQRLDMNVEEVYIAALLHAVGEMALWTVDASSMLQVEALQEQLGHEQAQQQVLGFRCGELSLSLARAWNLPPLIQAAFDPAECEAHPRPRLASLANRLATLCTSGWYAPELTEVAGQVADTLHLPDDDVTARMHRVAAEMARTRPLAGVVHPATWLPMLPGPWPGPAQQPEAEPQAAAAEPVPPSLNTLQQVLDEIAAHLDGTLTLHDLMQLVLRGMGQIGLERVVFGLLTPDKSELRAKYVVGATEDAALKRFRFDLRQPHLLARMLARQQAFWLNPETRGKVASLLSAEMQSILAQEYLLMTLAVHGRVVGHFYADRGNSGSPMDAACYEDFKALCTRAAEAMAHLAKSQ